MTTEELIAELSKRPAGAKPPAPMGRALALGLAAGLAVSVALFLAVLGPRPGLLGLWADPLIAAKTLMPLAAACLALTALLPSVRPGAALGAGARALWLVPALAAGLFALAFAGLAPGERLATFIGHSIQVCLPAISLLSLPLTAGIVAALRRGAPEHPARAGALAGLVAGGLAAAVYSTFCTEDSPVFYAVWYSCGIGIATGLGALAGARWLRW
ncbi:NrsF family protein [Pseudoroseicyclus sp. CXY001]|uniref:NrsF family protein n=1 Tax=Pseudoroseicyclus sp. CXY001 TaxID=3242492 RepID=UPI003570C576